MKQIDVLSPYGLFHSIQRNCDETMMDRDERELDPVRRAGLVEDAGQVVLDRILADSSDRTTCGDRPKPTDVKLCQINT